MAELIATGIAQADSADVVLAAGAVATIGLFAAAGATLSPDTKAVIAFHAYASVPTWGHSGSSFVLHLGNLVSQTKHYFGTDQGKEINDLIRSYVNYLCAVGTSGGGAVPSTPVKF